MLAARLLAVDPGGLGGIALRARAGEVRDRFLAQLHGHTRRLPPNIADDALLGGLDVAATLAAGSGVRSAGLLASLHGATLVAPMAETMPRGLAGRLGAWLDGEDDAALVTLDEGCEPDEQAPASLLDRLAFHVDLTPLSYRDAPASPPMNDQALAFARAALPDLAAPDDVLAALCGTALALGVASPRAGVLALRAARAAAALAGHAQVTPEDAACAARLVLAPRAKILPAAQEDPGQAEPAPDEQAESRPDSQAGETEAALSDTADIVLQAARAAIPAGLLAAAQAGTRRGAARNAGATGVRQAASRHGRPVGVRAAAPGPGLRLNLLETLRAAAPWQRLRAGPSRVTDGFALHLRREDFRVVRTEQRTGSTMIFLVDASGSAALARLAEAKGAVELLLADCYRRRDQVAVIAFRGRAAQTLLPPTRSLVRAKRSLALLPGGGGTPLAAGIDAGHALAERVRRGGATPMIVLLTDGRANVTRAGTGGRAMAAEEAGRAARQVRASAFAAILLDTAPRPSPEAGALARAMGARYVPLPYADAAGVSRAVRAASAAA